MVEVDKSVQAFIDFMSLNIISLTAGAKLLKEQDQKLNELAEKISLLEIQNKKLEDLILQVNNEKQKIDS
jgi:benzoyl-CoA reductase/2-hydroxyglutaryl-CoA dehydratase subunit BcrC/BadD/HgdB